MSCVARLPLIDELRVSFLKATWALNRTGRLHLIGNQASQRLLLLSEEAALFDRRHPFGEVFDELNFAARADSTLEKGALDHFDLVCGPHDALDGCVRSGNDRPALVVLKVVAVRHICHF